MRVLVLGSSVRGLSNWLPGIDKLESRGAEIRFMVFPRLYDANSIILSEFLTGRVANIIPFYDANRERLQAQDHVRRVMQKACLDFQPDIAVVTTCHIDPEASFLQATQGLPKRPIVLGMQHGYYQDWQNYTDFGPCFDYFFTFGEFFFHHFPEKMQPMLRAPGLPKLDLVTPIDEPGRDVLFLAQGGYTSEQLRPLLKDIEQKSGLPVRIRPHPELHEHYQALMGDFAFDKPATGLLASITAARYALSETTTAVLEFLKSGKPLAILPGAGDFDFRHLGLMADQPTAEDILNIWGNFEYSPEFLTKLSGVANGFTSRDASEKFCDAVSDIYKKY